MPLGLYPQEENDAMDTALRTTAAQAVQPSFLQGAGAAAESGVGEGLLKGAIAITPPSKYINIGMPPIGAPDWAYKQYEDQINHAAETPDDEYRHQLAVDTTNAVKQFAPDPHSTGTAGQILHGVVSGATRMVAGSVIAGPLGGAVAMGGSEGVSTTRELEAAGVDDSTATLAGVGTALISGVGARLPGGFGSSLATRIATGAGSQEVAGLANRGMMHTLLSDAGYDAQAQQYKVLDGQAMLTDAVLGAVFGGVHHVISQDRVDAAHSVAETVQAERDLAPGVPVTPQARDAHIQNLVDQGTALMNDELPDAPRPVDTIVNPAQESLRDTNAQEATQAAAEASGEPVGSQRFYHGGVGGDVTSPMWFSRDLAYAQGYANKSEGAQVFYLDVPRDHPEYALDRENEDVFGNQPITNRTFSAELSRQMKPLNSLERRADAMDAARATELRQKGLQNLSPDETAEYARLLESDRLAAKVGGRRMQGVLNDDAYAEMLQRGEQLPVQGFIDMDMLKSLNDTYGHAVGDSAIRTLGESLGSFFGEGNVFRRSSGGAGDEFIVQSKNIEDHAARIQSARQYLDNHTLRATDAAGNVIAERKGIGFSHGAGPDIESAERAQYADKEARKRAGLRTEREQPDRGAVAAQPAAQRGEGAGGASARPQAAVKTPAQAVSALTGALKNLRDSNGTDEAAHGQVRALLDDINSKGMDAAAIERQAAARAGKGADEALAGAKASETAKLDTGALDPEAAEAVGAAQAALKDFPDITVEDENGVAMPAHAALAAALEDVRGAQEEGNLHTIAAACFGRG